MVKQTLSTVYAVTAIVCAVLVLAATPTPTGAQSDKSAAEKPAPPATVKSAVTNGTGAAPNATTARVYEGTLAMLGARGQQSG
jgi:hypothetical protein